MSNHKQSLSRKLRIFFNDRFACRYCGRSVLTGELSPLDLTIDHIDPQATGGADDEFNFITACKRCNELKANVVFSSTEEAAAFIVQQRHRREKSFISNALYQAGFQEDRADLLDLCFAVERKEATA